MHKICWQNSSFGIEFLKIFLHLLGYNESIFTVTKQEQMNCNEGMDGLVQDYSNSIADAMELL